MITVVLPTFKRPDLVAHAVGEILKQSYAGEAEVLVIDSTPELPPIDYSPREGYSVRQVHAPGLVIGAARRIGQEEAQGDIIVHWNDDDWYSPERIDKQLAALKSSNKGVVYTGDFYCYEPSKARAWRLVYKAWGTVGTFAETKAHAKIRPIPDREDGAYWGVYGKDIVSGGGLNMLDSSLWILMVHGKNGERKQFQVPTVHAGEVHRLLGAEELDFWTKRAGMTPLDTWGERGTPQQLVAAGLRAEREPLERLPGEEGGAISGLSVPVTQAIAVPTATQRWGGTITAPTEDERTVGGLTSPVPTFSTTVPQTWGSALQSEGAGIGGLPSPVPTAQTTLWKPPMQAEHMQRTENGEVMHSGLSTPTPLVFRKKPLVHWSTALSLTEDVYGLTPRQPTTFSAVIGKNLEAWNGTVDIHIAGKAGELLLLLGWIPALRRTLPRAKIVLHTLAPYAELVRWVAPACQPDETIAVPPKHASVAESAVLLARTVHGLNFSASGNTISVNPYYLHGTAETSWVQAFGDAVGVGGSRWTKPEWVRKPAQAEPYALALASSNAHSSRRRILPFTPAQWEELAGVLTKRGLRCLATGSPEDPRPPSMPSWEWVDCPLVEAVSLAVNAHYVVGWQSGMTVAAAAMGKARVALIDEVRERWPHPSIFAGAELTKTGVDLSRYEEIVIPFTGRMDARAYALALSVASHTSTAQELPRTDIMIVTYAKDADWLRYCLRSIRKFCTGFGDVIVAYPNKDATLIEPICREYGATQKGFDEHSTKGHLHHLVVKCEADLYCPDADYVLHVDSDCVFHEPTTPEDYFVGGKPVMMRERYDRLGTQVPWRPVVARALGFNPEYETMRRHPSLYPRTIYAELREHVEAVHHVPFDRYVLAQEMIPCPGFCEFNSLGALAIQSHEGDYHWVDPEHDVVPANRLRQFYSHGGLTEYRGWLEQTTQ
jgi:hypothetical protein